MDDIRQMYRAAPGLVIAVAAMLGVGAVLGLVAILTT